MAKAALAYICLSTNHSMCASTVVYATCMKYL